MKFRTKLVLAFSLATITVVAFALSVSSSLITKKLDGVIAERHLNIEAQVTRTVVNAVLLSDYALIEDLVEILAGNPSIRTIRFSNEAGYVTEAGDEFNPDTDDRTEIPLIVSGELLGNIDLTFNNIEHQHIMDGLNEALALSLFIGVPFVIIGSWLFSISIARRLEILGRAVTMVSSGRYDMTISVQGKDELSDLAVGMNAMTASIAQTRNDLNKSVDEARSSEARFRRIVDALPGAIAIGRYDKEANLIEPLEFSEKFPELFGYSEQELKDPTFYFSIFPSEDRELIRTKIAQSIRLNEPDAFRIRVNQADGSIRWIEARGTVTHLGGDTFQRQTLFFDRTDEAQAEILLAEQARKIEESEENLRAMFDVLPVGIGRWEIGDDELPSKELYSSEGLRTLFNTEELAGEFFGAVHRDDFDVVKKQFRNMVKTGIGAPFEYRAHRNNDLRYFLEYPTVTKPDDGGKAIYSYVVIDITDLKEAELDLERSGKKLEDAYNQLQSSHGILQNLTEALPIGFTSAIPDENGVAVKYEYISDGFFELYGVSPSSQDPATEAWSKVHTEYRQPIVDAFANTARGEAVGPQEYLVDRNGRGVWLMIYPHFSTDVKTGTRRRHSVIVDITEKKQMEIELIDAYNGLEKLVTKRTAQLQESNAHLEETLKNLEQTQDQLVESDKMASLGQLVGGVAHEINTPIGVALTAVSNLALRTKPIFQAFESGALTKSVLSDLFETMNEANTITISNLNRAAKLISSFKQVAVDQTNEEARLVDIKDYTENVLQSLIPVLKPGDHSISLDCDPDISVYLPTGPFAQIITNLMTNAATHAFDGIRNGEIHIKIEKRTATIHIEFSDNGKGMEPTTRAKVFDPFFTTKRGNGGSGLGMHIAYNIVTQALNGRISCRSSLNTGTTFDIELPMNSGEFDKKTAKSATELESRAH